MSDRVNICMDIGGIASWRQLSIGKVGISRAVESLALALSERPDVHLTLAGFCGSEPLYFSYLTTLFPYEEWGAAIRAEPTVRSRFGLGGLYRKVMPAYVADVAQGRKPGRSDALRSGLLRSFVKILKIVDARRQFDIARFDVILSTTIPLPSREETRAAPRVMMIFDLICIRQPEWVTRAQTEDQEQVLASIDVRTDWILCNSEFVRRDICAYLEIDPARVLCVPLGASCEFACITDPTALLAVRAKYKIPAGPYLLGLAAFQPRKNVPRTIRAFARLVSEHPDLAVSLVLAGKTGQSTAEIAAVLADLGPAKDRIIFTGYVADEDLSPLYSGARAFVFPSLAEGFGLPPLEAMRCRVPVITANTTSLPEVVGDAALLVDPEDEEAIYRAMKDLVTDDALCGRLALAGWERAQHYTWKNSADALVTALRRVSSGVL